MKYIRCLVGTKDLIYNNDRWYLWLEDLDPKNLVKSPVLRERVEATRKPREESKPTGDAFKLRKPPHLFRPNKVCPQTDCLCISSHFSENRPYFTADILPPDAIASTAMFTAEDPDRFAFAIISSSILKTWQDTIGGRIGSGNRFAKELVWNTFPMPDIDENIRYRIINAGRKILEARELRPDLSLDEQYKVISPELVKAHSILDAEADKAFGAKKRLDSGKQRLQLLFDSYKTLNMSNP